MSSHRYYIDLRGDDYERRFLVDGGKRLEGYTDEEALDRVMELAEEHMDHLTDGRATQHPRFIDRTSVDPPEGELEIVVEGISFWPIRW